MDINTLIMQYLVVTGVDRSTTDATKSLIANTFSDFLLFVTAQGFQITVQSTSP